jgi:hypothetical protein
VAAPSPSTRSTSIASPSSRTTCSGSERSLRAMNFTRADATVPGAGGRDPVRTAVGVSAERRQPRLADLRAGQVSGAAVLVA